uniref:Secreted protein n=1 Tax=Octopus bimaculoides TaxID=37653 RepID=A0A0L8FTJ6_OCTBM
MLQSLLTHLFLYRLTILQSLMSCDTVPSYQHWHSSIYWQLSRMHLEHLMFNIFVKIGCPPNLPQDCSFILHLSERHHSV